MFDDNWDLINGEAAHEIETLNHANQVNVIEALFRFLTHHVRPGENGGEVLPNVVALKEIHRTGTLFLLERPGEFREINVCLKRPDGSVAYEPPRWEDVPDLIAEFFLRVAELAKTRHPLDVAAFALWRINWIHPFKNGNGRSARAFAYACLCLRYGFMLPGTRTILDLIMENKRDFENALATCDRAFAETGSDDVSSLVEFLVPLLVEQLNSVPLKTH